jgi:hypothetical protein
MRMLRILLAAIKVSFSYTPYSNVFQPNNVSILNTCPTSDLSTLDIDAFIANTQKVTQQSADHCAILDNDPQSCITTYGYPFLGPKAYNPLNLPSGVPGTDPLTNEPGNAFTGFAEPAFTLVLFPGYSSIITPVPFNTKIAAATQSPVTGSDVGSATATRTGSGSVAATGKSTGTTSTGTETAAFTTTTKASDCIKVKNGALLFFSFVAVVFTGVW